MSHLIDATRSLLLVVDVQTRLHPAIAGGEGVLAQVLRLARIAALLGIPAWGTEHVPEALGPLHPSLAPHLQRRFRKTHFDATGEPGFAEALPPSRPDILLCGYEAHVCVLQTGLGLLARGHRVFLVRDAVGSRAPASRKAALGRMAAAGATLVTVEMAAFEGLRDAGDPRFREVLRLVK